VSSHSSGLRESRNRLKDRNEGVTKMFPALISSRTSLNPTSLFSLKNEGVEVKELSFQSQTIRGRSENAMDDVKRTSRVAWQEEQRRMESMMRKSCRSWRKFRSFELLVME